MIKALYDGQRVWVYFKGIHHEEHEGNKERIKDIPAKARKPPRMCENGAGLEWGNHVDMELALRLGEKNIYKVHWIGRKR